MTEANGTVDNVKRVNAKDELNILVNSIAGGVGIYHYYFDGRIEKVYLNDGYYDLIGCTRKEREAYEGFSVAGAANAEDFKAIGPTVLEAYKENRAANLDLRIKVSEEKYKWLNVKITFGKRDSEKVELYVCYSDIDELKRTKQWLESGRQAMNVAVEHSSLSFWLFDMDKKEIDRSAFAGDYLGYPEKIENMPDAVCGTGEIVEEDEPAYLQMYEKLYAGAETSDCTVRIMNHKTGKYEWLHIVYTRLPDSEEGTRLAVGYSANVDLQQENRLRYEHEAQLRREIIRNSLTYYQINLTAGILEEYRSISSDTLKVETPCRINDSVFDRILDTVYPDDRQLVKDNVFADGLFAAYNRGENRVEVTYRCYLASKGLQWIRAVANIMSRPSSGDIISFLYTLNVDEEVKNRIALESLSDEEIESIAILNRRSGCVRFVKIRPILNDTEGKPAADYNSSIHRIIENEVLESDKYACERFFLIDNLIANLEKAPIVKITYCQKGQDGSILRKNVRALYLDETHEDIIIVKRDITDLYMEEQRQKKVLEEALTVANSANKAKSEFVSRMSHDMRTPLNAILALSGHELTENVTEAQMRDYMQKIHSSGTYLLGIINDILDMARIESRKIVLNKEPYSFTEFISTLNTVIGRRAEEKGVNFVVDIPNDPNGKHTVEWLMLDKVRFNQVFINLLSNAVKFTPSGGTVEFRLISNEITDTYMDMTCIVRDTGIGMDESFLPHAFESFKQENRNYADDINQGTGLGLTIVKQIVELAGGTVRIDSQKNVGTTVTINVKVEIAVHRVDAEKPQSKSVSLKGIRVLLCEDNPMNAMIVMNLLNRVEATAEHAVNGREGVEKFKSSPVDYYDVILMDIRMPVMDGLDATRILRSLPRDDAKYIPIIALTADAFAEDTTISMQAGMNAHMTKPIDPQLFYDCIVRHLAQRMGR